MLNEKKNAAISKMVGRTVTATWTVDGTTTERKGVFPESDNSLASANMVFLDEFGETHTIPKENVNRIVYGTLPTGA